MRQAGRYLPEYRAIRSQVPNFMSLCYDSPKAAEVTLQPIERFNMDAAIIFADILLVLDILGLKVEFVETQGPIIEQISSENIKGLSVKTESWQMDAVANTVALTKTKLPTGKSLIGFAGSPWTVATYAIEGRSKSDFTRSKVLALENSTLLTELIELITQQTIVYLEKQILAGATMIKLFDSWAGILHGEEYYRYVIEPTKLIINYFKTKYSSVPIIAFPKGSGYYYEDYIQNLNFDVLAVDANVPIRKMAEWQSKDITVQGNLDPLVLLLGDQNKIKKNIDFIFNQLDKNKLIFNLGHGILPSTPSENVKFLVDYVKQRFA
ncbi:MAG: uroporphyrinogen decarboxylase [Rickettsiaceae bacterium]|nr:uroporphyrinogen decarboxylase [Rickettsiaceae bacterium]